jgi:acylphosphatase
MRSEAQNPAVADWVRNRSDSTVEVAVHGEPAAVDAIVLLAQRGLQHARIERVDIGPDDVCCRIPLNMEPAEPATKQ